MAPNVLVALWCVAVAPAAALQSTRLPARPRVARVAARLEASSAARPLGLELSKPSAALVALAAAVAVRHPLPRADVAFSLFYPAYLVAANAMRFGNNADAAERPHLPLLREGRGPWFKTYVRTFARLAILAPLPLVFFAPRNVGAAAAPHLFLLLLQCAWEGLTNSNR